VSTTRLVLVRHGHTTMNGGGPDAVMSGWTDLPLSALGEQQVSALEGHVHAEVIYASPLRRARDTARHCADGADILYDEDLREIGCGEVDGLPLREVQRRFADAWARNERQADDDFRWPGGESYAELRRRALAAVSRIAARHPTSRVALVTHAGVITQLLGHLSGTPPARWSAFRVGNASLTELDWASDRGVLRSFDDRTHLAPALRT